MGRRTYFLLFTAHLLSIVHGSPTFYCSRLTFYCARLTYFLLFTAHLLSIVHGSPTFYWAHLLSIVHGSPTFYCSRLTFFLLFTAHLLSIVHGSPTFYCSRLTFFLLFTAHHAKYYSNKYYTGASIITLSSPPEADTQSSRLQLPKPSQSALPHHTSHTLKTTKILTLLSIPQQLPTHSSFYHTLSQPCRSPAPTAKVPISTVK